ncbi:MAG: MOSC domain-containing protein [Bryobacteraceae bacterium]
MARVIQINISPGGLPKRPITEARVTPLGIAGDGFAHPHVHGGPKQALLLICCEVVDDLARHGYPIYYGAMGENLTVAGIDHRSFRAGQRYRIGSEVVIELTKPRGPCRALDVYGVDFRSLVYDALVKSGDPSSRVWGKSGFYASVISGGIVVPGAPIGLLDQLA